MHLRNHLHSGGKGAVLVKDKGEELKFNFTGWGGIKIYRSFEKRNGPAPSHLDEKCLDIMLESGWWLFPTQTASLERILTLSA